MTQLTGKIQGTPWQIRLSALSIYLVHCPQYPVRLSRMLRSQLLLTMTPSKVWPKSSLKAMAQQKPLASDPRLLMPEGITII